jgi:hypothetical protein
MTNKFMNHFSTFSHKGNENQNYTKILLTLSDWPSPRKQTTTNAGEDVE